MNGQKEDIESPPRADLETEDADVTLPEIDPDAAPEPAPVEAVIAGHAAIRHHLKGAPSTPGIYRMINAAGEVLYVGKAKNIRKRLLAYVRPGGHQARISRMIATTASVEFVSTATETEALLLEANLIKRSRPRFNVVMRDDKSFPYILITGDHVSPQICKHRGARSRGGDFYGPFASVWAVNRTINALQRAFLIRSCSDGFYSTRLRPCLLHQIKRCAAPCTGEISHTEYAKLVAQAKTFLSGGSSTVRERLSKEMEEASVALDFERAAIYRDRLAALSSIQSNQGINPRTFEEADVFAAFQEGGFTCIQVFFFRTGQNWGNRAYFPKADKRLSASEVLGAFLAQFYDDKPCPRLILISHEFKDRALLAEALSIKTERRVEISLPQRGEKKDLITQAIANAKEALGRKLAETSSQQALLAAVAECFALARPPRRVEVYDNSHIQGSNAVGAMVVAGPEGFAKNQYRKFNIRSKQLAPGDDYGMMREVLTRRFKRLIEESPRAAQAISVVVDEATSWPDLMLIDGGQGQLTAAVATLAELGINDVPVVAISKGEDRNAGRETFHVPGRASFQLPPRDPVLYFLERLRDEAHRFAIGSHRARRKKDIRQAGLQDIPGIGPIRKRALLHHFGTLRAIERAGMSDLEQVPGIDAETARKIYQYFHER